MVRLLEGKVALLQSGDFIKSKYIFIRDNETKITHGEYHTCLVKKIFNDYIYIVDYPDTFNSSCYKKIHKKHIFFTK